MRTSSITWGMGWAAGLARENGWAGLGRGLSLVLSHRRLEVDEDGAGHVLARAGLGEKGVERVVTATDGLVGGHLAVGLDAVLEAVQLPARVAGLHAALAQMDGDDLTHFVGEGRELCGCVAMLFQLASILGS